MVNIGKCIEIQGICGGFDEYDYICIYGKQIYCVVNYEILSKPNQK
jgi:hypothetical protein